ncbi:hypothetical protein Tco_1466400 [Tanacetum coccineum]
MTAEVMEIYMHQFWNTIKKVKDTYAYHFNLDKKKFKVDTKVFSDILQICPRLPDKEFVKPPLDDEELIYGALIPVEIIDQDIQVSDKYQMYLAFATGEVIPKKERKFKKPSSPKQKDTPDVQAPKKKALAKEVKGKGLDVLSEVAQVMELILNQGFLMSLKGDSGDEDESDDEDNDDDSENVSDYNDDDEKTESDEEEDFNLTQDNDDNEEEQDDEHVNTPEHNEFSNAEEENVDEEETYKELYRDVRVNLEGVEHEKEGIRDEKMIDTSQKDASQERSYELEEDDAHVTLNTVYDTQKTGQMQSSSVSLDFTDKLFNFENIYPTDYVIASLMDTTVRYEETSNQTSSLYIVPITIKSQILAIVDEHLTTRIGYAVQTALQSYTTEFEKEAKAKHDRFIDIIDNSIKDVTQDKIKRQHPKILPDFITPMIQSTVTESLENVVLAKSSSQPRSTYEAATSLTEFELKKILLNKMQHSKSYRAAPEHRDLYDSLAKSYKLDKELFELYGKSYSLKRDQEDKDKEEDPSARSD